MPSRASRRCLAKPYVECLSGAAAVPAMSALDEDVDASADGLVWEVTVSSLIDGLDEVLARRRDEKRAEYDKYKVNQRYVIGGVVRGRTICRLVETPEVSVEFQVVGSETRIGPLRVEVLNDVDQVVATIVPDGLPYSERVELRAGYYRAVLIDGGSRTATRTRLVKPPIRPLEAEGIIYTPTIDDRGKWNGKPSVHALIVGVSEYGPYLGTDPASGPRKHGCEASLRRRHPLWPCLIGW